MLKHWRIAVIILAVVAAVGVGGYFFYDYTYSVPGLDAPLEIRKLILDPRTKPKFVGTCVVGGKTEYYFRSRTSGDFNSLYSKDGTFLCSPDGGPDGNGDQACLENMDWKACSELWTAPGETFAGGGNSLKNGHTSNGTTVQTTTSQPANPSGSTSSEFLENVLKKLGVTAPRVVKASLVWKTGGSDTTEGKPAKETYNGYAYEFPSYQITSSTLVSRFEQELKDEDFKYDIQNFGFSSLKAGDTTINSTTGYAKAGMVCLIKSICQVGESGAVSSCASTVACASKP